MTVFSYCNLVGQISFYRETAFKHHMACNSEYHRSLEEKAKNRKDEGGPNACPKCKLSFKVSFRDGCRLRCMLLDIHISRHLASVQIKSLNDFVRPTKSRLTLFIYTYLFSLEHCSSRCAVEMFKYMMSHKDRGVRLLVAHFCMKSFTNDPFSCQLC